MKPQRGSVLRGLGIIALLNKTPQTLRSVDFWVSGCEKHGKMAECGPRGEMKEPGV